MTTISIAEVEMQAGLSQKEDRTPAAAASAKQMSCAFVRVEHDLRLDTVRSFGTGTNAIGNLLSKRDAALDFIAPYIQPSGDCRAKSSMRGTSPMSWTMRFRASSGFLECSSMWLMMT